MNNEDLSLNYEQLSKLHSTYKCSKCDQEWKVHYYNDISLIYSCPYCKASSLFIHKK